MGYNDMGGMKLNFIIVLPTTTNVTYMIAIVIADLKSVKNQPYIFKYIHKHNQSFMKRESVLSSFLQSQKGVSDTNEYFLQTDTKKKRHHHTINNTILW